MLEEQRIICKRCGFTEFVAPDKRRRDDRLCSDCRARPRRSIDYGFDKPCKPWRGDFDELDNPIEDGHFVMPGKRVCKHSDCCEITHIV